jgi:hypothetical protein
MSFPPPTPFEHQFSRQQQTRASYPTYPSSQHPSEARYHSGQKYGGSYNETSPRSTSADPRWSPSLGDPRGRPLQGPPHPPYHSDFQKQPTSGHLSSSNSAYPGPSRPDFPQNHYPESWREDVDDVSEEDKLRAAYRAGYRPSREAIPTAAANMLNQQSKAKSHPSLDHTGLSSIGRPPPYSRVANTPSHVSNDVPRESSGPTTRNRERTGVHPLETPNRAGNHPAPRSTELHHQVGAGVDIYPGRLKLQFWYHKDSKQSSHQSRQNSSDCEPGLEGK